MISIASTDRREWAVIRADAARANATRSDFPSLKHGTQVDRERIAEIRKRIKTAPWLKHKRLDQVSRMPVSIEVESTDKVGYLYNEVRKEVEDFFRTTLRSLPWNVF